MSEAVVSDTTKGTDDKAGCSLPGSVGIPLTTGEGEMDTGLATLVLRNKTVQHTERRKRVGWGSCLVAV